MPDYRRWFRGGGTYFFTVVTFNRHKIFRSSHARASLHRAIAEVRALRPFEMLGVVLLPDHCHCIWTMAPDEIHLPRSNNPRRNFLECVKSRRRTMCPVETATRSDAICHMDDIAIRLGRKLKWDPQREEFINDDQANRMLTRPMRSPWRL